MRIIEGISFVKDQKIPDDDQFSNHWVTIVFYAGIFVGFILMVGAVSMYDTLFPPEMRPTLILVGLIVAATSVVGLIAWFIVWKLRNGG